jgi:hypothetical protein
VGRWFFDVDAGVCFFTTNDDFFGGHVRSQQPFGAFQAHISDAFAPRLWVAADSRTPRAAGPRSTASSTRISRRTRGPG